MPASTFELFAEAGRGLAAGQDRLIDAAGRVLLEVAPAWHERFGAEGRHGFIEPLLFLHAYRGGDSSMTLDQILVGHAPVSARPRVIDVRSDEAGTVFLPRLGDVRTGQVDRCLALDTSTLGCAAHPNLHAGIEVCACGGVLVAQACGRGDASIDSAARASLVSRHLAALERAMGVIAAAQPSYAKSIRSVVQRVALFRSASLHSFAASACPGMVFLNVADDRCGTAFFVEDLAHQCGHAVFSAWTCDPADFLSVDPNTPLRRFTGKVGEPRTVYEAFHGIFTEAAMVACLGASLADLAPEPAQGLEALARLGFILRRFGTDLHDMSRIDVFAPAGERVLETVMRVFGEGVGAYGDAVGDFDYTNQGYAFDMTAFTAANGDRDASAQATCLSFAEATQPA